MVTLTEWATGLRYPEVIDPDSGTCASTDPIAATLDDLPRVIEMSQPDLAAIDASYLRRAREAAPEVALSTTICGPFSMWIVALGVERGVALLVDEPEAAERAILAFARSAADLAAEMVRHGADLVRFGEAYHRQIRRWCDEHGVLYTGHLLGEESLCGVLRWSGDIWEASRWMSAPGIDMLANMTGYGGSQPGTIYGDTDPRLFHLTVKLIVSTCRHSGERTRVCGVHADPGKRRVQHALLAAIHCQEDTGTPRDNRYVRRLGGLTRTLWATGAMT